MTLLLSVTTGTSPTYGQQNQTSNATSNQISAAMSNQTNQTGGGGVQQQEQQQNEIGIGTAQEIESLTPPRGGVGQQQEGGQLGIIEGLEKQTAGNETVGGLQTAANETEELLGSISERAQGFFN